MSQSKRSTSALVAGAKEKYLASALHQKERMIKLNVLSLFDGISCGRVALERAGIQVDKYYASEIDKYAIQVAMKNYPDTIQLGDVTKVDGKQFEGIDLLIGGSPCQGFSFAGKQLNFVDPRSRLFFEFVRILNEAKPKYFLLENVKMKKEYQDIISSYLGVEPIEINSALVSAQNRKRLYWTNIPGIEQPEDKGILLKDILQSTGNFSFVDKNKTLNRVYKKNYLQYDISGRGHGSQDQRAFYIDNKHGCLDTGCQGKSKVLLDGVRIRHTTILEKERLQTLPEGYTSAIPESQASKAIGNGWTVDVIAHIFSYIKENRHPEVQTLNGGKGKLIHPDYLGFERICQDVKRVSRSRQRAI